MLIEWHFTSIVFIKSINNHVFVFTQKMKTKKTKLWIIFVENLTNFLIYKHSKYSCIWNIVEIISVKNPEFK
jgi:hypothetical protein